MIFSYTSMAVRVKLICDVIFQLKDGRKFQACTRWSTPEGLNDTFPQLPPWWDLKLVVHAYCLPGLQDCFPPTNPQHPGSPGRKTAPQRRSCQALQGGDPTISDEDTKWHTALWTAGHLPPPAFLALPQHHPLLSASCCGGPRCRNGGGTGIYTI